MERDPSGISAKTPGAKLDAGKAPIFQGLLDYFPRAVQAVAALSAYGANKYSWKGWEHVADGVNRYSNAQQRHVVKESIEGPYDLDAMNDPKFPAMILHKTQVAWNALAALELYLREQSFEPKGASAPPVSAGEWEPILRMARTAPLSSAIERVEQMDPVPLGIHGNAPKAG